MKTHYMISLIAATAIFTGCGGGSDSSTQTIGTTSSTQTASKTINVQRGPILGAIVLDSSGQIASEDVNGSYTFTKTPTYPILASGGVIDVDRNGVVNAGDVANDLNLTTISGSVITMATTFYANPKTRTILETFQNDLNLSLADVSSKTPSDSKEIEAISNILYKYVKDNNISDLLDTNSLVLTGLNTTALRNKLKAEYETYQGVNHDTEQTEKDLIDELEGLNVLSKLTVAEASNESKRIDEIHAIYRTYNDDQYKTELEKIGEDIISQKNDLDSFKLDYEKEYGDLDYADEGSEFTSSHYQGESCAKCHSITGATSTFIASRDLENESEGGENESGENQFTSGGTIYTKLDGGSSNYAANYSLRLVLENTNEVIAYNAGRGTANVNSTFNTATVNAYTPQVLDAQGTVVNKSISNSHDLTRLDCNSCHTTAGTNNAPGRIVSFDYYGAVSTPTVAPTVTPDLNVTTPTVAPLPVISFATSVMPMLETNCKNCHGNNGNFSITTASATYTNIQGFGGINTTTPESSSLLQKAIGVNHGGGAVISSTSTEYTTIRDWIAAGANNN